MTQKKKSWREKHLDWVDEILIHDDSPIRESLRNKVINYNLYLGKTVKDDYDIHLNPNGLQDVFSPDEIVHYPIARPYLDVLIGEEADRRFEWRAIVTNPTAISEIEKTKNNMLKQRIAEIIENSQLSPEQAEQELKNYLYYLKFEYQDIREKRANLLLKHYIKELDLKRKFNEGFKNVTIVGEEAYIGEVINGRPSIELMDPKKTYVLRAGTSNRYEDADIIVTYDYIPPGKAVDIYHKHLSETEVKWLDTEPSKQDGGANDELTLDRDERGIHMAREEMFEDYLDITHDIYGDGDSSVHSEVVDSYGNVRRIRLFWKSFKKIKRIKYFDDLGNVQYRMASEFEEANEALGEEEESYWVGQWWEGVKLGKKIYPYIRPREIQFNKFSDPGYNHPGIVGQIYNTGEMKVVSPMDVAKPYQLLYDATMHKLSDALSKWFGAMPVVDKATIPEGWDITKWMYFARKAGIAVKDSFKEGQKGMATGKLAASVQGSTGQIINQPLGDFIQQQINMLNYVEMQMGRIIGVPPQRLGQIENRETVGGVERAVTQSSFITNELFKRHDDVKKRVLTLLVETAKVALKDNPQKFQHIGDDYLSQIFDIDDTFVEEEYGIVIDNENDLTKIEQTFEQLAHAAMQNQALKFGDLLKLFTTSSLSEKQRIIEQGEEEMMQRQEAMQERELQIEQTKLQQEQQKEQAAQQIDLTKHANELAMKKYEVDENNRTQRMKMSAEAVKNSSDLEYEYNELERDLMFKMKELDEKIRNNKATEVIQRKAAANKPSPSSQSK